MTMRGLRLFRVWRDLSWLLSRNTLSDACLRSLGCSGGKVSVARRLRSNPTLLMPMARRFGHCASSPQLVNRDSEANMLKSPRAQSSLELMLAFTALGLMLFIFELRNWANPFWVAAGMTAVCFFTALGLALLRARDLRQQSQREQRKNSVVTGTTFFTKPRNTQRNMGWPTS